MAVNRRHGEGTYAHVYSRGVDKRTIFVDRGDYERFILSMFACRGKGTFPRMDRLHANKQHALIEKVEEINEWMENDPQLIEIICFCLMPNHYHMLLGECIEGGISKFMQRLGDGYTKYFNIKRERTGRLFGSSFQSIQIDTNDYLLYLSRYIHRNPIEIVSGLKSLLDYPWSSYQDFCNENRWEGALKPNIILDQFNHREEYKSYVEENLSLEIDPKYFLDAT